MLGWTQTKEVASLRLDRWLKVSRLIRRRPIATNMCWGGRVKLNDVAAKPSAQVKVGDMVEVNYGRRLLRVRVEMVQESMPPQMAPMMYTVLYEHREPEPLEFYD
ncbi:MAG: RNA-binding S4 domain-containing protein [Bacillota bacterium]|nr:RNA-binding S4 domain-containing protein [Bacillota bacterium]